MGTLGHWMIGKMDIVGWGWDTGILGLGDWEIGSLRGWNIERVGG